MLNSKKIFDYLFEKEIKFYTGVPDSLLKNFCSYITDHTDKSNHIIAANEGNALSLGIGYHLSTNKIPLVYMQNSGLGNIINPLLSLADNDVYSTQALLMIGWRGEPGVKDEPQHKKQGRITLDLLDTMEVPYEVLSADDTEQTAIEKISSIINLIKEHGKVSALVVKKNTFEKYSLNKTMKTSYDMYREDAIKIIIDEHTNKDIFISTTGVTSRELFEYREELGQSHENDFYTVGGMGHASQIALGVALQNKKNEVYCLDGDGALLMHMGSAAIVAQQNCDNYKHILFNNGAHDSVGGQPTVGFKINFQSIAKSCGYKNVLYADNKNDLKKSLEKIKALDSCCFLEIKVNKGFRADLGRPTTSPLDNKKSFMSFLKKCKQL
ncbi:MAG: phosphonopyruvate decarboxylase [Gammaproteobacteria bacterium]|nr:phosphonopyruvate decarboxylase [Gammaproteobacteria bacterium]